MPDAVEFIDLQVNGYAGVDFNADGVTAEQFHAACQLLHDHGVRAFLPTIITDPLPDMCRRLAHLVMLRQHDPLALEMIPGFHIEGPFINPQPGYVGAHPPDAVLPAHPDAAQRLLDSAAGSARIVTLAPECDPGFAVTRFLSRQDVVVSAGHCDPSLDTLRGAIDAGLSLFTHLGNGCPQTLPRHDNIIQRVLSLAGSIRIGFIADGAHIPLFALKNYLQIAGLENCFIVSDAMSAAGLGPGCYRLGRHEVNVAEDRVARSPDHSHLVGSATTLARSASLLSQIGLTPIQIRTLTHINPRFILQGQ